jgi:hypothetical protein
VGSSLRFAAIIIFDGQLRGVLKLSSAFLEADGPDSRQEWAIRPAHVAIAGAGTILGHSDRDVA